MGLSRAQSARASNVTADGTMWDDIGRLHEYHGYVPVEMRVLKLTEEVGEAAEAPTTSAAT
jgi:hypothetical protein